MRLMEKMPQHVQKCRKDPGSCSERSVISKSVALNAVDKQWGPLQLSGDHWYMLWPRGGSQLKSYSDIERSVKDYSQVEDRGWSPEDRARASEAGAKLSAACNTTRG